jgi:hypothetical protein
VSKIRDCDSWSGRVSQGLTRLTQYVLDAVIRHSDRIYNILMETFVRADTIVLPTSVVADRLTEA